MLCISLGGEAFTGRGHVQSIDHQSARKTAPRPLKKRARRKGPPLAPVGLPLVPAAATGATPARFKPASRQPGKLPAFMSPKTLTGASCEACGVIHQRCCCCQSLMPSLIRQLNPHSLFAIFRSFHPFPSLATPRWLSKEINLALVGRCP